MKSTELDLDLITHYKLSSVIDSVANILSNSDINISNQKINVIGTSANASLLGTAEGELTMNLKTGIIEQGISQTYIKGNLEMMGTTVPITLKITKKITTRKLN